MRVNEKTIVFIFLKKSTLKYFLKWFLLKLSAAHLLDYKRLNCFDVLKINDEEKLIVPLKPGETNIQYYVANEELFSILYETPTRIGHGGRTRKLKELQVNAKILHMKL